MWPSNYQNPALYGLHYAQQFAAAQMSPMMPGTSGSACNDPMTEPSRKRRFDDAEKENQPPKIAKVAEEPESSDESSDKDEDSEAEDGSTAGPLATPARSDLNNSTFSQFAPLAQSTPLAPYPGYGMMVSSALNTQNFSLTPNFGMTNGSAAYNNSQAYSANASSMWATLANAGMQTPTSSRSNLEGGSSNSNSTKDSSGSSSGLEHSSDSGIHNGMSDKKLALSAYGPPPNVDINAKFDEVNSRLTLLTTKKYIVTVGEILRRTNLPEQLNSSTLGGYLRRAKNSDAGPKLRQEFKQKVGIALPEGRRKAEKQNSFTPLVEQEAADFASDYDDLSMRFFPRELIARYLLRGGQLMDIQSLYTALNVVRKAIEILANDRSPGSKRGEENLRNPATAHPEDPFWVAVTKGLTDFSLRTHGFGVAAHQTAWQSLAGVFEACIALTSQNAMLPGGFQMPGWNHTFPGAYAANFMGFNPAAMKTEQAHGYP
ncbi:transcription factor AP-2 [Aphelenchoides avenae]|nr:transcription factor AP-2 [Aphelenchus avenae]